MEEKKEQQEQQELPLEEAFSHLDEMIAKLADKEVSLEESFAVYAEGTKLLKYCRERLDQVEKKMLVMNEEGGLDEF